MERANYKRFYALLFKPIADRLGPLDTETLMAILGFDFGGPVSLCTVGHSRERFVTYVSCELAVRDGQQSGKTGPYEVMMTCDDEDWARRILTRVGRMSFNSLFEHGHSIDLGEIVGAECPMQGLVVEEYARVPIDGRAYGILRIHGVTRPELEFAMMFGTNRLLDCLKRGGVYPRTSIHRRESVETGV